MAATRSETGVYMIGYIKEHMTGSKLPTLRDILKTYFYKLQSDGTQKHGYNASGTALCATIDELLLFWRRAHIPTKQRKHVSAQLKGRINEWQLLKKNRSRKTEAQAKRETKFDLQLDVLFDIAPHNVMDMIKIEEDRQFLTAQRESRGGVMAGVDKCLARKEIKKNKVSESMIHRKVRQCVQFESVVCSSSDSDTTGEDHSPFEPPNYRDPEYMKFRGTKNVYTPKLLSTLDRTKCSDRSAVYTLDATLKASGSNTTEYNLNRSSLRRHRELHRSQTTCYLKEDFHPDQPLTVHWDGKLMQDLTGTEKVDRLPIIVSGKIAIQKYIFVYCVLYFKFLHDAKLLIN